MTRFLRFTFGAASALLLSLAALPLDAAPMLTGTVSDADSFFSNDTFSFTNSSTAGEQILSLTLTIPAAYFFDTTVTAPGVSPSGPTPGPSSPTGATFSVLDGSNSLTITYTNFDPAEFQLFGIDVDAVALPDSTVFGSQLLGTTVSVSFSNGVTQEYTFVDDGIPANGIAGVLQLVSQTEVPEPVSLATWSLLGIGGAFYHFRRQRRA